MLVPSNTLNGPSGEIRPIRVREGKTIELSCPVFDVPPSTVIIAFDIIERNACDKFRYVCDYIFFV